MAYPDNRYPADPDFPTASNQNEFDVNFLTVVTEYITDLTDSLSLMNASNIYLDAGKSIQWNDVSFITENAGTLETDYMSIDNLSFTNLTITGDIHVDSATIGTLNIANECYVQTKLLCAEVTGDEIVLRQTAEPADGTLNDDEAVIWLSSGSGIGDVGDIMIKIKHGGVIKSDTLIDFA